MTKNCKFCDEEIETDRDWQVFCSPPKKCRQNYWKDVYTDKRNIHKRIEELEKKIKNKNGGEKG